MYDCTRQYRCTIIRGKSQKEMDDLLPAYAKVIDEVCPCEASEFEMKFNNAFMRYLPAAERVKKTLDNHRTEISGKLFGMYFFSEDGKVYESERTQNFLRIMTSLHFSRIFAIRCSFQMVLKNQPYCS